jgi:hypothetical protein
MTRKDYYLIADTIRESNQDESDNGLICIYNLLHNLCRELKNDNPRFNESKFREYVLE